MVYVALSRATSIYGLFLTNKDKAHKFYHSSGKSNKELRTERLRLENHILETIGVVSRKFLSRSEAQSSQLTMCTINIQSFNAHRDDFMTDSVFGLCKLVCFSETWVENDQPIEMLGYRTISRFKRKTVRAEGVAICENIKFTI